MQEKTGTRSSSQQTQLPDWVVARLRQDNEDISQAIIDMVIWVDRVKCWMYQTDADFAEIMRQITKEIEAAHAS
jgi:hypothetical protein